MTQNIINIEQSEYWNEKSGPKWVKLDRALNERFAILTDELFSRADIRKKDRVLDLGCGGGETSFLASKLVGNNGYVMGADISETLLKFAKSKFSSIDNLDFNICDIQNYKFEPNSFDRVISRFGVMFFENPKAAFKNIYLSMKSRARLNFVCWSNMLENEFFIEGTSIIEKYTENSLPKTIKGPGPFAFTDQEYIEDILRCSGFKDIQIDERHPLITTEDSITKETDILLSIGPRAKMLSEANLPDEIMLIIRNRIEDLCKKRQNNGKISYNTCLNYVSATK